MVLMVYVPISEFVVEDERNLSNKAFFDFHCKLTSKREDPPCLINTVGVFGVFGVFITSLCLVKERSFTHNYNNTDTYVNSYANTDT